MTLTTSAPRLQDKEFKWIRCFLFNRTGIQLSESKRTLVVSRLEKRLRHFGLRTYSEYFKLIQRPEHEQEQIHAVDLLTTNETYFFREPEHFDFLKKKVIPAHPANQAFRVWSAASSTGEEAYSIAMLLSDSFRGDSWEIVGTDISSRVVQIARQGLYPMASRQKIPPAYLKRYCLKGTDEYDGKLLMSRNLRGRIRFLQGNLLALPPDLGQFQVIFLRNVMIYFDIETKRKVVADVSRYLQPGGVLLLSHSESLNGITSDFKNLAPSIYQKPS